MKSPLIGSSWGVLKSGNPSHHPFFHGIFPYKPSVWGTPHDEQSLNEEPKEATATKATGGDTAIPRSF